MTRQKRLVLDANILLRGVFGVRVRTLLETYEDRVVFYSPDICFEDARRYIPELAAKRGFDPAVGLLVLEQLGGIVQVPLFVRGARDPRANSYRFKRPRGLADSRYISAA